MIVLGLVLALLAVGLLLAVVFGGANDRADYVVGGLELEMSTMAVFLIGAVTLLIFVVGLSLVRSGTRRAAQRRKDQKELGRLTAKLDKHERRDRDADSTRTEATSSGSTSPESTSSEHPDHPEHRA